MNRAISALDITHELCTAYMADYDLNSDQTQTYVYACLAGVAVNSLLKQAGIKFGVKFANGVIKNTGKGHDED